VQRRRRNVKNQRWVILLLALIVGPALACWLLWQTRLEVIHKGGKGAPDLMLLHGFGASAEGWLPYTQTIALPAEGRFLFPKGPGKTLRRDGVDGGRAWWDLNLAAHLRQGKPGVDLTNEDPRGLERAGRLVSHTLSSEGNKKSRPFILGGFSQGAMVSCQVAFTSNEPLAGLVLLSGTPTNQSAWRAGFAKRKGLPIFMSHGRSDDILPFDLAENLHAEMVAAGLDVTFVPFNGGHEIPEAVVVALNKFLAKIRP
jgi:phospholipase/carboxylesterase